MDEDQAVKRYLWISRPYMQDEMTWCVANARPRDLWSNVFRIYSIHTWIGIGVSTLAITLTMKLLTSTETKFKNFIWAFMFTFTAILGKSVTYASSRASIRIMMSFLFIFGLIISTSFCTFLISTLTQPRLKHQIDNVPDAIRAGFKFAGGNIAYSHYLYDADDPVIVNGL